MFSLAKIILGYYLNAVKRSFFVFTTVFAVFNDVIFNDSTLISIGYCSVQVFNVTA